MNSSRESNPFRSPTSIAHDQKDDVPVKKATRLFKLLWLATYFYPVIFVLVMFGTWLIGWFELGHPPRPSLDDPKDIGGLMDIAYPVSGLAMLAMPAFLPLGFLASFVCPFRLAARLPKHLESMMIAAIYTAICAASRTILVSTDVPEWWFD